MRTCLSIGGLVLCGALLMGCDSAPGATNPEGRPPQLSEFTYTPEAIVFEGLPDDQVTGEVARVPISISVKAQDGDDLVEEVAFVVQAPLQSVEPILEGTLSPVGSSTYEATATLELAKADVGNYTLLVYAVDESGLLSNQMRATLPFKATGSPPVIEGVRADPPVVRPPTSFRLIVTVSDPDGLTNISRVLGTTPNGTTFELIDDGSRFGDAVAGDGDYTAAFDVPAATPGVQTFTFQAFDRLGLASEVVSFDVTIE